MKKILYTITILLVSTICYAQPQNIKIDNGQFIYEKIFTIDSLTAGKLDTLLQQYLPTQKGVTNLKIINQVISANFTNLFINWAKYDANNLSSITHAPMTGNINIQIKDGKYKVLVNTIAFNLNMPNVMTGTSYSQVVSAETIFLKSDKQRFRTREDVVRLINAIDLDLTDLFAIKTAQKTDW